MKEAAGTRGWQVSCVRLDWQRLIDKIGCGAFGHGSFDRVLVSGAPRRPPANRLRHALRKKHPAAPRASSGTPGTAAGKAPRLAGGGFQELLQSTCKPLKELMIDYTIAPVGGLGHSFESMSKRLRGVGFSRRMKACFDTTRRRHGRGVL